MAEIKSRAELKGKVILELTEEEARALYNITVYGHKPFTDWFYKHLGQYYLKPHHDGLVSLFDTIQQNVKKHLTRFDKARKIFQE